MEAGLWPPTGKELPAGDFLLRSIPENEENGERKTVSNTCRGADRAQM